MSLKAFLSSNVDKLEDKEVVISDRFKDDEGIPMKWIFRPITAEEDDILKSESFTEIINERTGRMTMKSDSIGYSQKLTASSVKFPDLLNAELQDSYGVTSPEALLGKMLYSGEYTKVQSIAQEVNKMNDMDDLVDEAKNE